MNLSLSLASLLLVALLPSCTAMFLQAISAALASVPFTTGPLTLTAGLAGAKLAIGAKLLYFLGYFGKGARKASPTKSTAGSALNIPSGFSASSGLGSPLLTLLNPYGMGYPPLPFPYSSQGMFPGSGYLPSQISAFQNLAQNFLQPGAQGFQQPLGAGQGFDVAQLLQTGQGFNPTRPLHAGAGLGFDPSQLLQAGAGQGFNPTRPFPAGVGQGFDPSQLLQAGQGFNPTQPLQAAGGQGFDPAQLFQAAAGQGFNPAQILQALAAIEGSGSIPDALLRSVFAGGNQLAEDATSAPSESQGTGTANGIPSSPPTDDTDPGDTEDDVEGFFTFLQDMDDNKCISRLICDIGGNPNFLGEFSQNIDNIIRTLNPLEDSKASYYVGILKSGGNDCAGQFSACTDEAYNIVKSVAPSVGIPQNINPEAN